MTSPVEAAPEQAIQPIYIVSGGVGASGELLTRTVLAQFPNVHAPLTIWPFVHEARQVDDVIAQAVEEKALIVHTLVNGGLRRQLSEQAVAAELASVDLAGPLLEHLATALHAEPLGQPGRYRTLYNSYFKRIEAIEFAVNHDDGKRIEELPRAEIVLLGVSRVGKTPLSIYLSLQGWKVANVPLVTALPLPAELEEVPRERVVGLTIEAQQLLLHRRHRQRHMGIDEGSYVDRQAVIEEVRAANHLFYGKGYTVIDMTDKPIETSSEEVIAAVTQRLGQMYEITV